MTLGPGGTAQLAVKPGREWTEPLEWAGLAVLAERDLPAQMATAPGTVLEAAMETEAGTEMDAEEEIITGEGEAAAVVEELEVSEV